MIDDSPTVDNDAPPVPLDTIARKVDYLDAMLVCHVADGQVYAKWIRPGARLDPERFTAKLGDTYRTAYQAVEALRSEGGESSRPRARSDTPLLTIELDGRALLLIGIRAFIAVFAFSAEAPLGLSRLAAKRLSGLVAPELPFGAVVRADGGGAESVTPGDRATLISARSAFEADPDRDVQTIAYDRQPSARPPDGRPSEPTHGRERLPTLREVDRAERLLSYLEQHAPEPHVVKLRVALRAGLSLAALEHPESLGADAIVLIETAAEDILGVDRAELRGLV